MPKQLYFAACVLLFSIYFINGIVSIPQLSTTADELDHFSYAARFVKGYPEKIKPFDDASTMPVTSINTLPRLVEQLVHPGLQKSDGGIDDVFMGRYMTLLFCALIGYFVLKWSAELYGPAAGVFSLFLFVFCPNLNAHTTLVTTDAFAAFFTLTSAYYFCKAVQASSWKTCSAFAMHLAFAQLSKQSLTYLFFIYFFLFVIIYNKRLLQIIRTKVFILKGLVVLIIILFVLNVGFQFQDFGLSLKQYPFRSHFFYTIKSSLSFLDAVPLPFSKPYLLGLDLTKYMDELGGGRIETSPDIYVLGKSRKGSGFWYYYFVVLFFKTPVPVLICTSLVLLRVRRMKKKVLLAEWVLLFCCVFFLCYFNFFYNSQVGLRHLTMIFPLLYVLLGSVVGLVSRMKMVIGVFLCYSIVTFYYFFPNLIAYTNEFVFPKRTAYRLMADSNIDYEQGRFWLQRYLRKHPFVKTAIGNPAAGQYLISVNDYLDLNNRRQNNWIRNFKPLRQVHHCYLLFDISEEAVKKQKN